MEGTWVVAKIGDAVFLQDNPKHPKTVMTLKPDGTFTVRTVIPTLDDYTVDTKGTYRLAGGKVILDGRTTSHGGKRGLGDVVNLPISRELTIEKDRLIQNKDKLRTIFIRKGAKLAAGR